MVSTSQDRVMLALHHVSVTQPARDNPLTTSPWLQLLYEAQPLDERTQYLVQWLVELH